MPDCGSDRISYTIQVDDVVLDGAGLISRRATAENIAYRLNYPVSVINLAADELMREQPLLNPFEAGITLCLINQSFAAEIGAIEEETASTQATAEVEVPDLVAEAALVDSTVVPAYMLRTEEDFLRYLWVEEFRRPLANFNINDARSLLNNAYTNQLLVMRHFAVTNRIELANLPLEVRLLIINDETNMRQILESLSTEALMALYAQVSATLVPIFEQVHVILEDALTYDFYQQTYADIQHLEAGQNPSEAMFADYQTDLATETYLKDFATGRDDTLLYLLAEFVWAAAHEGFALGGFDTEGSDRVVTIHDVANWLSEQLGPNWTAIEFERLSNRLTSQYRDFKTQSQEDRDDRADAYSGTAAYLARQLNTESDAEIAAYHSALALDNLRAIAYDPTWNPAREAQLLADLSEAIGLMPRAILTVDVGWVQDSFRSYYTAQKEFHDWRMQLKASVDQIELAMLHRQQAEAQDDPLWWVGFVGETLLGFFDVFDAIFTLRDALQGDSLALGFLAIDLALPIIGDAIMNIRRAVNALPNVSDTMQAFMRGTENFVSTTDNMLLSNADNSWGVVQRDATIGTRSGWQLDNARPTDRIINQSQSNSCLAACGATMLNNLGIDINEETVLKYMGYDGTNNIPLDAGVVGLNRVLEELAPDLPFRFVFTASDSTDIINNLNAGIPVAANLRNHAVIVDGIITNPNSLLDNKTEFIILDPWGQGAGTGVAEIGQLRIGRFDQLHREGRYSVILLLPNS